VRKRVFSRLGREFIELSGETIEGMVAEAEEILKVRLNGLLRKSVGSRTGAVSLR